MKIAVYTIALNEAKHVKRWAKSAEDADYRLILDTGSKDNTVATAEKAGVTVVTKKFKQFKFDEARNAAVDALPDDVDYCISLDADEVLHEGWRELLEEDIAKQPNATQFSFNFINSRFPDGTPAQQWARPMIHPRHNARWKWPIHEIIEADPCVMGSTRVVAEHFPDRTKPRKYLPMLKQATKDLPDDPRMSFYYGRELCYNEKWDLAEKELRRCLTLNGWAYEKSETMVWLSRCNKSEAEQWLLKACAETPDRREPFVELAELYFNEERWEPALGMAQRAISMANKNLSYISEDKAWGFLPHHIAAICAYTIKAPELALHHGKIASSLMPDDENLKKNLEWYEKGYVEEKAEEAS